MLRIVLLLSSSSKTLHYLSHRCLILVAIAYCGEKYGLDYTLSVTFHFRMSSPPLFHTPLADDPVSLERYLTELFFQAEVTLLYSTTILDIDVTQDDTTDTGNPYRYEE